MCTSEIHEAYRIYPVELNEGKGTSSAGSALWIDRCYRYATYSLSVCLSDWLTNARQRDIETDRETARHRDRQTNRETDDIPGDIQFPARELNNLIALAMLRELLKHMAYVT